MWLKVLQTLLFPVSLAYNLVTTIRNAMYDWGVKKSYSFKTKTIGIGNLSMGGTGKTPHVEYLVEMLSNHSRVAILSRGYKRKSKGFILASDETNADNLGDELFQIFLKFRDKVIIAADSDRVNGIQKLESLPYPPDIILLDDVFQHRRVRPGLNILICSYSKPYYRDNVFPSGFLRENRSGRKRADFLIVSKCPMGTGNLVKNKIIDQLKLSDNQPCYFTGIEYDKLYHFQTQEKVELSQNTSILMVTGFVQTEGMKNYLNEKFNLDSHLSYPDHHDFSIENIDEIREKFNNITEKNKFIVISEKDAARFYSLKSVLNELLSVILILPIRIKFLTENEELNFNQKIFDYVDKNK